MADNARCDLRPPAARLPGMYWLLVGGFAFARSGAVAIPFLSLYLVTHLHHSPSEAAHVSAAFGAGWLTGPLIAGMLTDRIGRRATLQIALLSTAGACLVLGQARSLTALGAAAFAVGFFFDAPRPAVTALITDMLPSALRARGFGRLYWAMNAGAGIAAGIGSLLADSHFTYLFLVDAAANMIFALVMFAFRAPAGVTAEDSKPTTNRRTLTAMLRDRTFIALCGITLAWLMVYQQMLFGLPLAMSHDGLPASAYGIISLINAALVLVLQPCLQPAIDRSSPATACMWGALLTGAGMGAHMLTDHTLGYAAAAAIWTAGEVLFFGAAMTSVAELAPAHARGRYAGVWSCTLGLSALAAPQLAALAMKISNLTVLWATCALLGAAAAAACTALRPDIDARRPSAEPAPTPDTAPVAA
ncbi:MFS transporter [Streptomyces sp. NPDC001933]|uniref:MFS transporter n=1 Tax=Streptomyces sp. NPDC001933 TaxID=3364626 RepID=UPI0036B7C72F